MSDDSFIRSKDGTQLLFRYRAADDARASLLFVHGYGEHSGRYAHVMERYHGRGFNVAAFDYRGHGRAEGVRSHCDRFPQYDADLNVALEEVLGRSDAKVFLIGHSFGGLMVTHFVLQQPEGIDGVALSCPCLGFKVAIPAWKSALGRVASIAYPTMSIPNGIPAADLSHDPEIVSAYENDPLVNKTATARWYTETVAAQHTVLRQADQIQLPLLLMLGGDDRICDADTAQNFLAALGSPDKELHWYDGLYHEIFNELEKEAVLTDLDAWLDKHL